MIDLFNNPSPAVAWAWTEAEARIFDTLSTEATRMALATSKKNSSRRGRGKPDRLETHDPKPEATKAPPIPDHVTPVGVEISSLRHPCDACGTHWEDSKLTRSAADATEPIRHVVYAVNDAIWPVITPYEDEATGKPTIDIWPVKADLLSVWLCPSCYAAADAQGLPVWAWDFRQAFSDAAFARKSSRGVPELCRERFDEMEAEWARERAEAAEARWRESVAEESARQRKVAGRSAHVAAMERAEEINEAWLPGQYDGKPCGIGAAMLVERGDRLAILSKWFAFSVSP